jgi:hypothetical protein
MVQCRVATLVFARRAGHGTSPIEQPEIAIAALQHYMTSDSYAHMLNRPVISLPWPAALTCTAQHGQRG